MIYIVEYEGYENNEHKLEITGKTVSREEYDDFMENFKNENTEGLFCNMR